MGFLIQAIILGHLLIPILALQLWAIKQERRRLLDEKRRLFRQLILSRGR